MVIVVSEQAVWRRGSDARLRLWWSATPVARYRAAPDTPQAAAQARGRVVGVLRRLASVRAGHRAS